MYIAIDLWNTRSWIAITQESIVLPYGIVQRIYLVKEIRKILLRYPNIHTIVVGLPYDLYGKDTKQLKKTEAFIEKISHIFPKISILWHDERFSSVVADEWWDQHRDDIAAQHILQSYLDSLWTDIIS